MLCDKLLIDGLHQLPRGNLSIFCGKVVNIHHPKMFEPITSVIQKFHNNMLYFKVTDILKNVIKKGDSIFIQLFYGNYEYAIHGIVNDFSESYPYVVELFVFEIKHYKNKRKSKRFIVNFDSQLSFPVSNEAYPVIIKSVSSQGLSIITKEQFDVGVNVYIEFSPPTPNGEYIKIKTRIVRASWFTAHVEYGLEIIDCKDPDVNRSSFERVITILNENEKALILESLR